ncbi:TnsA endonuclease N-terminal domain-containing protein [Melaminivora sp.]|uniref:TnsA endonuclease N-terminal domain-containing protein n=1 Tax=Melaminivora sp. TaxID=1933032 RepID=UPI0028A5BF3C|nr:TnsA endonuclease N-terminal domain-containing protein [Melaminivora sp.]
MIQESVQEQLLAFLTREEEPMVRGVVRKVRENPFSVTARLSSKKLGQTIQAESLLEYDFLNILDFDPRVEKYGAQCLSVPWIDPTGRRLLYTPDVLVKFTREAREADRRLGGTIFEVKPSAVLSDKLAELKPKYRATMRILRGTGVRFKLITDRQINRVFAANVRFLLNYKVERFQNAKDPQEKSMDAALLKMVWGLNEPTTPQKILDEFSQSFELRARLLTRLWYFVAICALETDLIEPLTMNSVVWPGIFHRPFQTTYPTPKWRQEVYDWYR